MNTIIDAIAKVAKEKFTLENIEGFFNKASDSLVKGFERIGDEIKNTFDKYIITIPYDRNCERFVYQVSGQELHILVETLDECKTREFESEISCTSKHNELNVTLPKNVNATSVSQKYDSDKKIMTLTFSKTTD